MLQAIGKRDHDFGVITFTQIMSFTLLIVVEFDQKHKCIFDHHHTIINQYLD